jgi:hypothetical protein
MKTSDSIEEQTERKAARSNADSVRANTRPAGTKSGRGDATRILPWRWQAGTSGNPSGRPKHDLAAEIAKACFENNADALYKAFSKALLKGNAYAFKELSDRAYGRLKEKVEVDVGPYRHMSDADLRTRIAELEKQLGYTPALPPAEDEPKPN